MCITFRSVSFACQDAMKLLLPLLSLVLLALHFSAAVAAAADLRRRRFPRYYTSHFGTLYSSYGYSHSGYHPMRRAEAAADGHSHGQTPFRYPYYG